MNSLFYVKKKKCSRYLFNQSNNGDQRLSSSKQDKKAT